MAKVNKVDKKVNMTLEEIIKFQIITYCYINRITISESELNCLTLLGLNVKAELSDFCNACCAPENKDKDSTLTYTKVIFKTPQTVRNALAKLTNYNIISKDGLGHNKTIELNKDLKIQIEGNILLDYKFFYIGTQES
jgi:hypothetical protein